MRAGRLELPHLSGPGPKPGASAGSATLACAQSRVGWPRTAGGFFDTLTMWASNDEVPKGSGARGAPVSVPPERPGRSRAWPGRSRRARPARPLAAAVPGAGAARRRLHRVVGARRPPRGEPAERHRGGRRPRRPRAGRAPGRPRRPPPPHVAPHAGGGKLARARPRPRSTRASARSAGTSKTRAAPPPRSKRCRGTTRSTAFRERSAPMTAVGTMDTVRRWARSATTHVAVRARSASRRGTRRRARNIEPDRGESWLRRDDADRARAQVDLRLRRWSSRSSGSSVQVQIPNEVGQAIDDGLEDERHAARATS